MAVNNNINQAGVTNPTSGRPPVGTGYTNLQSFLGANDANKLGNTLSSGVQGTVGQTVGNIQGAQNQFQTGTQQQQNSLGQQQNSAQNTLNQIVNAPSTTTYSTDASGNPVQGLVNSQGAQGFNNYLNAQYQGPQSLQNYNTLLGQYGNAQQNAGLLGSQGGQQQLLRTYVNQPGYTNNLQNLDSIFLGSKPIQQNLQNAKAGALQQLAQNNVSNLQAADTQQAQQNAVALQQGQQALQQQTGQDITGIQGSINQQLQSLQNKSNIANAQQQALMSGDYSSANLTPQQQQIISAYQGNSGLGQNALNNFINYQAGNLGTIGTGGAANQTQAAQLAALGQLTNNSGLNLTGPIGNAQAAQTSYGGNQLQTNAQNLASGLINAGTPAQISAALNAAGISSGTSSLPSGTPLINGNTPAGVLQYLSNIGGSAQGAQNMLNNGSLAGGGVNSPEAQTQNYLNNLYSQIQGSLGVNPSTATQNFTMGK